MLENFEIDLKAIEDEGVFSYSLDDAFFKEIDAQDISGGQVEAQVIVKKMSASYELGLHVNGVITILCDRCLDDMIQPIEADTVLKVKFGPSYKDDGDDLIIVPEELGKVNVAWFLYEVVALSIPIQHVHEPGKCNEEMMKILKEHSGQFLEDENNVVNNDSNMTDPRWNDLKKLLNNN
ncbi:MAG: DUF177 domain-containing protein [Bacteroidaceae bacterium]|nr:DUF177 domain-containing protein [Bacteroidaceae bacterium]